MTAGTSLDPAVVLREWPTIDTGVLTLVGLKATVPTLRSTRSISALAIRTSRCFTGIPWPSYFTATPSRVAIFGSWEWCWWVVGRGEK
eukprot:2171515-Prymnesium_polylepis.2